MNIYKELLESGFGITPRDGQIPFDEYLYINRYVVNKNIADKLYSFSKDAMLLSKKLDSDVRNLPTIRYDLIVIYEILGRNFVGVYKYTLANDEPLHQVCTMCDELINIITRLTMIMVKYGDYTLEKCVYNLDCVRKNIKKCSRKIKSYTKKSLPVYQNINFSAMIGDAIGHHNIDALYQADLCYAIYLFKGRDKHSVTDYQHAFDLFTNSLEDIEIINRETKLPTMVVMDVDADYMMLYKYKRWVKPL